MALYFLSLSSSAGTLLKLAAKKGGQISCEISAEFFADPCLRLHLFQNNAWQHINFAG